MLTGASTGSPWRSSAACAASGGRPCWARSLPRSRREHGARTARRAATTCRTLSSDASDSLPASQNAARGGGTSWMWQVCRRLINDRLEKLRGQSRWASEELLDDLLSEDVTLEESIETKELYRAMEWALGRISEEDRSLLLAPRRRGPRSEAWKAAMERLRQAFWSCYEGTYLEGA